MPEKTKARIFMATALLLMATFFALTIMGQVFNVPQLGEAIAAGSIAFNVNEVLKSAYIEEGDED